MSLLRSQGLIAKCKGHDPKHKKTGSIRDIERRIKALRSLAPVGLADLMGMWRSRDLEKWSSCSEIYELLGERILEKGEPLLAYDIVNEGVTNCPMNVRLRQLQGLALARSGATERASRILEQLRAENHIDEETLGMLGRTYKDHAARAVTPRDAREFLRRAAETYTQAYKINAGYWAGINAATSFLLLGNKKDAARLAKKVEASCLRELKRPGRDDYWLLATLGEAALILRDWSQARDWYAQAGTAGLRRFGDLQSSRCNARLILNYWKVDPSEIERCLQIPRVAVFAGHIIDRPGRPKHRFPTELEPAVAEAIGKKIQTVGAGIGYSSAACGSDILFLEAMLDLGGEIVLVLPYEREQFSEDSVNAIQSSRWRSRFERVLGRATRVITASKQHHGIGGVSYDYANQILLGLASIHARRLDTELAALAVWDGLPGDGGGGTASAIERWLIR